MIAECKNILIDMVKILESKAIEVVKDPKLESEVNDKPESGKKLLSWCHCKKRFPHNPQKL